MFELLAEPLTFPFMQRALVATSIVAVVSAVVGVFVVARGLAFVGDALAHASFAGIAMALLLRRNIYLGAAVAAVATSIVIAFLSRRGRIGTDLASGVLFAGAFALGVVLISPSRNYTVDLFAFVFGNVLGIGPEDLVVIGAAGCLALVAVAAFGRDLVYASFDPLSADAEGRPVELLHYLLLGLIGLTVVAAVKAVGIVLVVTLLVAPAASAMMLASRFRTVVLLSGGLALAASLAGFYVSFYANVPSGAATVLVSTAIFGTVLLLPARRATLARESA